MLPHRSVRTIHSEIWEVARSGNHVLRSAVRILCQLRHKLSAAGMLAAFRLVNSTRMRCFQSYVYAEVQQLEVSYKVLLYVSLYTIVWHTYRIVEWFVSCYCPLFKPYYKKEIIPREDGRHIMFLVSLISSHCYDLNKTLSPETV
jgi:hypothetical protein